MQAYFGCRFWVLVSGINLLHAGAEVSVEVRQDLAALVLVAPGLHQHRLERRRQPVPNRAEKLKWGPL